MPLDLDGKHLNEQLRKAPENTLEGTAAVQDGGQGEAEVSVNRRWSNGWDLTTYAKAWWKGTDVRAGGGVKVRKTWS